MPNLSDSKRRAASVRIFLVDGTADGLRLVEKSNWTGRALMCSRAQFPEVRSRAEFEKTGVYVLLNQGDGPTPQIYIGEADGVSNRIDSHYRSKEFWTHLILFTSKDENLNKAHVQYLEARLIELARRAKRSTLENSNSPEKPTLAEADIADAEAFLEDMLVIYPLLGLGVFSEAQVTGRSGDVELFLAGRDTNATGLDTPNGFVVLKGSIANGVTAPSTRKHTLDLRSELVASGVFLAKGATFELQQDYVFGSSSGAAAVFLGRPASGLAEWKDKSGTTLRDLQESALEKK